VSFSASVSLSPFLVIQLIVRSLIQIRY